LPDRRLEAALDPEKWERVKRLWGRRTDVDPDDTGQAFNPQVLAIVRLQRATGVIVGYHFDQATLVICPHDMADRRAIEIDADPVPIFRRDVANIPVVC
jgi:hypothetical protein